MFKSCCDISNKDITPYIIVLDFENTTEKKCGGFDEKNEKIYSQLLKTANKAERTVENSGLSMNLEVPPPPHPNNRDRYIIWKKRNVKKHVIPQSEAIIFLHKNSYNLNEHYEAYQAIDLMNEIKKSRGIQIENPEDKTIIFDNVYTPKDKNILRRKSIHCHQNIKPQVNRYDTLSNPINIHPQSRARSNTFPKRVVSYVERDCGGSLEDIKVNIYPDLEGISNLEEFNNTYMESNKSIKPMPSAPPPQSSFKDNYDI